jgi:hypothetical protein
MYVVLLVALPTALLTLGVRRKLKANDGDKFPAAAYP